MLLILTACGDGDDARGIVQAGGQLPDPDGRLFTRLPSRITGVRFTNRLSETRELNVFTYRNFFNGGGVALGDLTGDGLPELVLTANQGGARLFLNRGDFRFRDVTNAAGLTSEPGSWTTGVTLADVNGDGRLDLYVCRAGHGTPASRANQLWINEGLDGEGRPTFVDRAAAYGIADQGWSTQGAFFDYDRDGDLDLFVVNNSPRPVSSFAIGNARTDRHPYGGDRLYRNDGGRFADVSVGAGIHGPEQAFGLGIAIADVNRDGWPDVYVGNDFFERDYLYVNNKDGTFAEALDRQTASITYYSMGLDVADADNDGWPDIYTTDMLPEDDRRLKLTATFDSWESYQTKVRSGYHHQAMRNMLQRNNGDGTFTDVGQMAGVARTDWSWSALLADFDLDGYKDVHVTNGIAKDITSQDYVSYLADAGTMRAVTDGGRTRVDFLKLLEALHSTPLPNYAFRNEGAHEVPRFTNVSAEWGLDTPGFSSGAAYGDLDGDGALDLVVNNVNDEAFVYRNTARTRHPDHHYLRVRLVGEGANRFGLGARVTLYAAGVSMMQEQAPTRGFQSSVDYVLGFGLGRRDRADSLGVEWPDGRVSMLRGLRTDTLIVLRQVEAVTSRPTTPTVSPRVLVDVTERSGLDVVHRENEFIDFNRERLLPRMLSIEGPALASGDVNGDGLDDLYLGGAKDQAGRLVMQRPDGQFSAGDSTAFIADAVSEDVGAVFFDANGDGSPDLYVVSGGTEYSDFAAALQDRLYLNNGRGQLRKVEDLLPPDAQSGSRPAVADVDGDGDLDLFIGGRSIPWRYGLHPESRLLLNDGRGRFIDATARMAPALGRVGMVTDAIWVDINGDARPDLVVVGEWMRVTIFLNRGGRRLEPSPGVGLEASHGWWTRVVAGDLDADGRTDLVVGNLGLNTRFQASAREPVTMHVKDVAGNGVIVQLLATYNGGKRYPLALRDDLIRSVAPLRARFLTYAAYAGQTFEAVFPAEQLQGAIVHKSETFASTFIRNEGNGRFTMIPLPDEAQLAPVYALLARDVTGDGHLDVLLAGNFDGVKPEIGRMSEGRGLLLRGNGKGGFVPTRPSASGFAVEGQARGIARVRVRGGERIIVARNHDRPLVFRIHQPTEER